MERQPDTVRGRQLGQVRAGDGNAGRAARGQAVVVGGGRGVRAAQVRHTAVGEPVAGRATGRRPLPRAAVLRPAGLDRAVPRHRERGPVAPVVGRRPVPERDAHRMARARAGRPQQRHRGGRLRDRARPAHRAADPQRRPHGAVRSTDVGARSHHPVHVRHTVPIDICCPPDCRTRFENRSIISRPRITAHLDPTIIIVCNQARIQKS